MKVFFNHCVKISVLGVVLLGTGCSYLKQAQPGSPQFAPTYPALAPAPKNHSGSIYQAGHNISLYNDRIASRRGDIITIRLEETTSAKKYSNTKTDKKSDATIANPTLFGQPVKFGSHNLGFSLNSDSKFDGGGESNQSNSLKGVISVTVSDVLPNGNLIVQGETWIQINQGKEYVRLTGLIRPDDIEDNNTVSSQRVANARITYSGTGQLQEANRMGWLQRFFNRLWPF